MTWLGWLAILGPIVGGCIGVGLGYVMGATSHADEVGELKARIEQANEGIAAARGQLNALAAAPPTRGQSARVLDLVSPGGSV